MNEIIMIDIERLHPHPQNPRKDLGDLTELIESIKVNGVLQNLTVVPIFSPASDVTKQIEYIVIIGHRRLAAAKASGLKKLPCVIVEMDAREQLSTMMVENMQRSDLTIYEQAQGFQLMLDFGETVDSIAEMSGFSASTIRRRVKLLEYDEDSFKKSVSRGGTLADYVALDKIEDAKEKAKLLDLIGTNNFNNEYRLALDKQKRHKTLDEIEEKVSRFAKKKQRDNTMNYVTIYNTVKKDVIPPDDVDKTTYYYIRSEWDVTLYKTKPQTSAVSQSTAEADKQKKLAEYEAKIKELKEVMSRHRTLRQEYIKKLSLDDRLLKIIVKHAIKNGGFPACENEITELLEIDEDELETEINIYPLRALVAALYLSLEDDIVEWRLKSWAVPGGYKVTYTTDAGLTEMYAFLKDIGYEMSDEEVRFVDGTHPIFVYEEDAS